MLVTQTCHSPGFSPGAEVLRNTAPLSVKKPPVTARIPSGQVNVPPSFSPPASGRSSPNPVTSATVPAGPRGPAGPCGPAGPAGPPGPVSPLSPLSPLSPFQPHTEPTGCTHLVW